MTVIQVTEGAPEFSAYADFLDGETPVVHRVGLSLDETGGRRDLVLARAGWDVRFIQSSNSPRSRSAWSAYSGWSIKFVRQSGSFLRS